MTDIKDYRNSELKNYVIGNILLVLYFSGMFSKIFSEDVNSNLDIWSIVIESALISSIIYINAQWYRLYRDCKNENKILIANRDFLLCRDITIITLMLLIIYMMLSCLKIMMFSKIIVEIMGVELIVSNISMRGKAKRLAYNVISEDIYK